MTLVLGSNGQLGTAFAKILPDAVLATRSQLDLSDIAAIRPYLESVRPEAVINCAAYTAVDRAEEEESLAFRVNAEAVAELAGISAELDVPFVTFSTDYVFDGDLEGRGYLETDEPNPINAYGRSKLEGEIRALDLHPGALVIRTSWVNSGTHRCFVDTIRTRLEDGQTLSVVDDQRGRPTFVVDLAPAALSALRSKRAGLLHLTNQGQTTWFGLARDVAHIIGVEPERVSPVATGDYPTPAKRPRNSVLDSVHPSIDLPHYRETLAALLEDSGGVVTA